MQLNNQRSLFRQWMEERDLQEFALVVTVRVGRYAVHHFTDCMEINRNEAEPTSTQLSAFHFCAAFVRLTIINKSFVVFLHFVLNDPKFSVHYTRLLLHAFMSCLEFLCFMIYVKDANMSEGMAKMKVIWSWIERIWSNQMCVKDIKFSRQS